MKRLTKIRLVNWYHVLDEIIPIRGSVLFTGDNGSGKSTILDAIQFALVADLTQVRFNQAANEQAARTLQGYTRWMLSTEGTKETHRYGRNDCVTYVLLEFQEEEGGDPVSFTVGVVIDSYQDGRDPSRLHFIANRTTIEEVPVYRDGSRVPLSTVELRQKMAPRKGVDLSREPGAFRDKLLIRLGRLSPDFTKLLVKAAAFKPLGQVQQFVLDFLLDPRSLETRTLQENLAHYKALEVKAQEAERRIAQLDRIASRTRELDRTRDEILSFRFLELRGLAGIQEALIEKSSGEERAAREELDRLRARKIEWEAEQRRTMEELGSVWRSLSQDDNYVERERVKDAIRHQEEELARIEARLLDAREKEGELVRFRESLQASREVLELLAGKPWDDSAAGYHELAYLLRRQREAAEAELKGLREEGEALQRRLEDLRRGVRPFPREAKALKELIEDRLAVSAPLLCELIEVTDERWQSAVEGYLNTRRFDIVPEPRFFAKALALYERMKRQLGLHGVGLVDSEKALRSGFRAKANSLAEVVTSSNPYAKAYADFLMGDLVRCESEDQLRNHARSITPGCMVYQNHAARQTAFHIFDSWFIGSRGTARLAERTEEELRALREKFVSSAAAIECWKKAYGMAQAAETAAAAVAAAREIEAKRVELKAELQRLREHLDRISTTELLALEGRLTELRQREETLKRHIEENNQAAGRCQERVKNCTLQREGAVKQRDSWLSEIAVEFGSDELRSRVVEFEDRYEAERQGGRTPEEIHQVFSTQKKARETQRMNLLAELTALRAEYNNQFGFSAPVQGEDLSPYVGELSTWRDSLLPEYRGKIGRAKEAALQQLMEDIVHRLRENLDLIPEQFEQINRALRGFHFGLDQYQFTYRVKREFEAFERLIREAAEYEEQPLFETDWKERFRAHPALEALFESLVSGSSARVQEELEQYSDYRRYYDYDLKILHADGTHSLYSQVNRLKSGGETQTPYYIAVLASLYRLYRLQPSSSGKQRATIGLVILDEAFNKMDEDHLRATLEFTRRLGLQLIMATPKERAEYIIPHVESCWIVQKDPGDGVAFLFDFHQELDGERGGEGTLTLPAREPPGEYVQ